MDRQIFSFSIAKADNNSILELKKLKDHSKKTGITFSHLIIKAITSLNKELKL